MTANRRPTVSNSTLNVEFSVRDYSAESKICGGHEHYGSLHQSRKDKSSKYMQQICNHGSCMKQESCNRLENVKVIDRESDKTGRLIREAVWIRKSRYMNQDDGSYQLSHVWTRYLLTSETRKSDLMKISSRRSKHQ